MRKGTLHVLIHILLLIMSLSPATENKFIAYGPNNLSHSTCNLNSTKISSLGGSKALEDSPLHYIPVEMPPFP